MLSVDEALKRVLDHAGTKSPESVALEDALGLVLAENVASDVDSPPHDKSLVDGYAVQAADVAAGPVELEILEEVTAGQVPTRPVARGQATRIMTGAPVPSGADAVVMIEQTDLSPDSGQRCVRVQAQRVSVGQNIMRQAASLRRGEIAVEAGSELRASEIGVLAEVGRTRVRAIPRPTVAVLTTGNELVAPSAVPAAGQIRNSNGPLLLASVRQAGAAAIDLGIARDEREQLRDLILQGLRADALVLSGGVSAGVLDLVPGVLAELGVEQVFHKIRLKPGKPLWFGVLRASPIDKLVFGLPGNPVSSLVCFELFVRPAIARLSGRPAVGLETVRAALSIEYVHRGDRPTCHPAELQWVDGSAAVRPLRWQGSGDLRTLVLADALAYFPAGERTYPASETIDVLLLPGPRRRNG